MGEGNSTNTLCISYIRRDQSTERRKQMKFFIMAQMDVSCVYPAQTKAGTIGWLNSPEKKGLKPFYFPETGDRWVPAVIRVKKDDNSALATPAHGRMGWLKIGEQSWLSYIFDRHACNWVLIEEYRSRKAEEKSFAGNITSVIQIS